MKTGGLKWAIVLMLLGVCAVCGFSADDNEIGNQYKESDGFVVHEWGVTRIFQQGGAGQCDAPDFVIKGEIESPWEDCAEKPVIYFYSAKSRTVDVAVGTPQYGEVLYWPPATIGNYQQRSEQKEKAVEYEEAIYDGYHAGEILWSGVEIASSRELKSAREVETKHWWAKSRGARANALKCGTEQEKFLFYEVPHCDMRNTVCAKNNESVIEIDAVLPYDANGKPLATKALYKNVFMVQVAGKTGKLLFKPELEIPATQQNELTAHVSVDFSKAETLDLAGDDWAGKTKLKLQRELAASGFYEDEARIIADIWNEDFFQKTGSRLIYFLDRETYDKLMPLYVSEAPDKTVRLMIICIEY